MSAFYNNTQIFEMMPAKYMTDENLMAYENFYTPIPTRKSTDKEFYKKVLEKALNERGIQFENSNLQKQQKLSALW